MKSPFYIAVFLVLLHEGSLQTTSCDDIKEKLQEISDSRDEAKAACDDVKESELSDLESSETFDKKRKDIETDINSLTESLECDDSEIAKYFQCHTDRSGANKASVNTINSKSSKGSKEYVKDEKNIEKRRVQCENTANKIQEKERASYQKQLNACENK
ncbi:hypothetical protein ACFFRR_009502 [Megaselia abdita]